MASLENSIENKTIKEILLKVKMTIETEGYCRAGYAIKEVMKCPNKDVLEHDKVKIASLACRDGKYKNELAVNKPYFDLNIIPNPDSNWFNRNPWQTEIIRFVLTVASAVVIFMLTKNL